MFVINMNFGFIELCWFFFLEFQFGIGVNDGDEEGAGDGIFFKADVYAMGLVLYELMTGQRIFAAELADAQPRQVLVCWW